MFRRKKKVKPKFEFSIPIRCKEDESYFNLNSITITCQTPDGEVTWIDCGEIKNSVYPTVNSFYDWDQLCSFCVAGFLKIEPTEKFIDNLKASRFIHHKREWKMIKYSDQVDCTKSQQFIIIYNDEQYHFWLEPSKYRVLMSNCGWDWIQRAIWHNPQSTINPLNRLGE